MAAIAETGRVLPKVLSQESSVYELTEHGADELNAARRAIEAGEKATPLEKIAFEHLNAQGVTPEKKERMDKAGHTLLDWNKAYLDEIYGAARKPLTMEQIGVLVQKENKRLEVSIKALDEAI